MDDDGELIYFSRWLQIHWNTDTIFFGIGFNINDMALGLFLGAISIYVGDVEYGGD